MSTTAARAADGRQQPDRHTHAREMKYKHASMLGEYRVPRAQAMRVSRTLQTAS